MVCQGQDILCMSQGMKLTPWPLPSKWIQSFGMMLFSLMTVKDGGYVWRLVDPGHLSEIHTREKNAWGEILGEQKDILKICKKKKVGDSIFFKCLEI